MAESYGSSFDHIKRSDSNSEEYPIREELFSVERLEQYASELAAEHRASVKTKRGQLLLPRLEENGRKLIAVYRALADAIRNGRSVSPAAEWLVDNFHIVEEQLREIRHDLPKSYYNELPKIENGKLAGYPRVYAIALALIAHTDCRLDAETLTRFIRSYQHVTPLSIGELWAIAITLRVALVENLRRLSIRMMKARAARERADELADKLLEMAGRQPRDIIPTLEAATEKNKQLDRAFVVQLTQRLRDQDPEVWPALDWMEKRLARESITTEQVVHLEHQRQAAAQVTVANIITSMRLLSTLDWRDFFEGVSLIDPLLAEDPVGAYSLMDFATRDRYRHVIERIAKRTASSEQDVARRAVKLAGRALEQAGSGDPRTHVGYYLLDQGLGELEKEFGYRARTRERFYRAVLKHPTGVYLGLLLVLTALILTPLLLYASYSGASAVR